MSTVRVGETENLESALKRFKRKCARDGIIGELRKSKRFKRKCARDGIIGELRKREAYEKPSVKRKKKAEAARKRMYKS